MARRGIRLTDKQWKHIEPLLPAEPKKGEGGRPRIGHRECLDGILWVLKTGARWRDLPVEYPSPSTCWRRLKRWHDDGLWLKLWRKFLGELDERGRIDWEEAFIDADFAPAKKGGPESEKPSAARVRSEWWWSTARVFLWEYSLPPRPRRRSRSSRKR